MGGTLGFNLSSVQMIQTLGAMRIIEGKLSELAKASQKEVNIGGSTSLTNVISKTVDLEVRVWNRLYQRVKDILPKYPTSLEQDLEILQKDKAEQHLTVNERNIIVLRVSEKRIIHLNLELALFAIELLKLNRKEGTLALKKIPKQLESATEMLNYSVIAILPNN